MIQLNFQECSGIFLYYINLYLLIGLQRNILFQVKPTCDWVSATVSSLRLVGHKRKCIRNFSAGRSL